MPKSVKPKKKISLKRNTRMKNKPNSVSKVFPGYLAKDPFPPKKFVKLTYTQTSNFTTGSAGVLGNQQVYSMNNLYDPDVTGVGHQPYGYDQMSLLYQRYKVNGVFVVLTVSDPSEDGVHFACQLTNPSNSSAFINTLTADQVQERQQAFVLRINNTGSQKVVKKFYLPIWQAAGVTKLQFEADPDNYTAAITGGPGNAVKLLMAAGSDAGTTGATVRVNIEITYYCQFYQRVQLTQS